MVKMFRAGQVVMPRQRMTHCRGIEMLCCRIRSGKGVGIMSATMVHWNVQHVARLASCMI